MARRTAIQKRTAKKSHLKQAQVCSRRLSNGALVGGRCAPVVAKVLPHVRLQSYAASGSDSSSLPDVWLMLTWTSGPTCATGRAWFALWQNSSA